MTISKEAFQKAQFTIFNFFPTARKDFENLTAQEQQVNLQFRYKLLNDNLSDEQLLNAVTKMCATTAKLFPGDNWCAMLIDIARPRAEHTWTDAYRVLMDNLVNRYTTVEEAKIIMDKIKSECPLAYVVGKKLGFTTIAMSENPDVLRAHIKAACETELERAREIGGLIETPADVFDGRVTRLLPMEGKIKYAAGSSCDLMRSKA